jgi:hypothetical protein
MLKKLWYKVFPEYKIIKVLRGEWNINVTSDIFNDYKEKRYCLYEILYSQRLNKYKLKLMGYDASNHPMYPIAIRYMRAYESGKLKRGT